MNKKITNDLFYFFGYRRRFATNGWDHGIRKHAATNFNLDFAELDYRHSPDFRHL